MLLQFFKSALGQGDRQTTVSEANPLPVAVVSGGGSSGGLTDAQLRASRVPVSSSVPTAGASTILALTTAATGTNFTAFSDAACIALDIVNNTGVTIEYRRGGAGVAMQIPPDAARMVIGITNANQISVRRTDTSNTQVTIQAEAFTA
jgi:hypothetical protein